MKVTMSPDRKYMTLEAEDELELLLFSRISTISARLGHVEHYDQPNIKAEIHLYVTQRTKNAPR